VYTKLDQLVTATCPPEQMPLALNFLADYVNSNQGLEVVAKPLGGCKRAKSRMI